MGQIQRVAKENIERARQLLISEILREQQSDRFIKREAVKQLLGPLIAARSSGLSFEEISKVFEKAGLELSPKTLRSYYFDLKTADELAREAQRHAGMIARAKARIDKKYLELHSVHGQSEATRYTDAHLAKSMFYTAFNQSPETATDEEIPQVLETKEAEPSRQAVAPVPVGMEYDTREIGQSLSKEIDAMAKTIDEIEMASQVTEERTVLEDDLTVKDGRIFYVSGRAFRGYLSKKQIHLLRSGGKVIAPMSGRSSKEFVAMPLKL